MANAFSNHPATRLRHLAGDDIDLPRPELADSGFPIFQRNGINDRDSTEFGIAHRHQS
jgi:hypothetical protein